jgi:acyl-[acyl-carrier-protein] desaturase
MTGLNEKGEMARDYLVALPDRFRKIAGRKVRTPIPYQFNWIN